MRPAEHVLRSETARPFQNVVSRLEVDRFRELWFGPERASEDPVMLLMAAVEEFAANQASAFRALLEGAEVSDKVDAPTPRRPTLAQQCVAPVAGFEDLLLEGRQTAKTRTTCLRVVLMGRTQAGKSTLLEAITAGDGARIGDGRQKFSRDVCERTVEDIPGLVLVDTPGVGAMDGSEDFAKAFAEVPGADLIVWVAANDSTQEETAKAIRILGLMGKPMVIALNCRMNLSDPNKYLEFLEEPDTVFDQGAGHINVINRNLNESGVSSVTAVQIHADAAFRARECGADAELLARNSRINDLLTALRVETEDSVQQRRALRMVDAVRQPAVEATAALMLARQQLRTSIDAQRRIDEDLLQRMRRVVAAQQEELIANVAGVISRRRTWHLGADADPEKDVRKAWERESSAMISELDQAFRESRDSMLADLQTVIRQVDSDWRMFTFTGFDMGEVSGFGSVWLNRAARVGFAVGIGVSAPLVGAKIGAKFGALAGIEGGPVVMAVTGTIGAVIGVVAGIAFRPALRLTDTLLHGKDQVMKSRREQTAKQLRPLLSEAQVKATASARQLMQQFSDDLDKFRRAQAAYLESQQSVLDHWSTCRQELETRVGELDTVTARALLKSIGRGRLARGVQRATRLPGVAFVAALTEPGFTEATLFPTSQLVERFAFSSDASGKPTCSVTPSVLLGMATGRIVIDRLSPNSATICLPEDDLPRGILTSWAELLTEFTHGAVTLRGGPGTDDRGRDREKEGTSP